MKVRNSNKIFPKSFVRNRLVGLAGGMGNVFLRVYRLLLCPAAVLVRIRQLDFVTETYVKEWTFTQYILFFGFLNLLAGIAPDPLENVKRGFLEALFTSEKAPSKIEFNMQRRTGMIAFNVLCVREALEVYGVWKGIIVIYAVQRNWETYRKIMRDG